MTADLLHRAARTVHARGGDPATPDAIAVWLAATPDPVAKALTVWLLAEAEVHDVAAAAQRVAPVQVLVSCRGEAEQLARLIVGET